MPIYEIHITVVLKSDEINYLDKFISINNDLWDNMKLIRPRVCHAQSLYGEVPDQPMFTCSVFDSESNTIEKLHIIRDKLKDYLGSLGIVDTRIRNKIELKDRTKMLDLSGYKTLSYNDHPYYEFHWKICHPSKYFGYMNQSVDNDDINKYKEFLTDDYFELETLCKDLHVHLSVNKNKFHSEQAPIATARFHNCSFDHAFNQLNIILSKLENMGYKSHGTVQSELAIYDDDIDFDKGWIFKDIPENIL